MCDYMPGRLIIGVPNDARGKDAVDALKASLAPDCIYSESLFDRVRHLRVNTSPIENSEFLYHLVEVPPGDESYLANYLVHNFNGQARSKGLIAFAQPDHFLSLASTHSSSNKDFKVNSFAHDQIKNSLNVKAAHGNNHLGKGVLIAVIDSGLAQTSPVRDPNPSSPQVQYSRNILDNKIEVADDPHGHGSAISWLIHDIAPEADIIIFKVADVQGKVYEWDTIAAIYSAYGAGVDIINLSLEFGLGTTSCSRCGRASHSSKSVVFETSLISNSEPKPLVVAATGNGKSNKPSYPAKYNSVLAVGSINSNKIRSSFSNYGVPHNNFLIMPGGELMSKGGRSNEYMGETQDATKHFAGTSMACAYATGMLALYKSVFPTYDKSTLLTTVLSKATMDIGWTFYEYGNGLLEFIYP